MESYSIPAVLVGNEHYGVGKMIITRTPLRVSLAGGGSDIRSYYARHGGAVVSFAIDKYVYVCVNDKFDGTTRVSYSKTENVKNICDLKHDIIRETLKTFKATGLDIATISDIPGEGTGLGSSSAVTVGLLAALSRKIDRVTLSPSYLAEEAYAIEANQCGHPVGKQDQYAVAHGGMNYFFFNPDETVYEENITPLTPQNKKKFEDHLLLLWTGRIRSANEILRDQRYNIGKNIGGASRRMNEMVDIASSMRSDIIANHFDDIGSFLDLNWALKKTLATGITNDEIDRLYQAGRDAGAEGGKLCGAGGGGFMLFWAPRHLHKDIQEATRLRKVDIRIEERGCEVIYEQA